MLHMFSFCRASFKKNAEFRQRCNGFFIDMLTTVCFKDNTPPTQGVINHLLSYMRVETGTTYCRASCQGNIKGNITVSSLSSSPFLLHKFPLLQTINILSYICKLFFRRDALSWSHGSVFFPLQTAVEFSSCFNSFLFFVSILHFIM